VGSEWVTPASFAVCGLVYLLSRMMPRSKARADAEGIALAITVSCGVYTTLYSTGTWPENVRLFALTDLACGLFILSRCFFLGKDGEIVQDWAPYKVVLLALLSAQIGWHAGFWFLRPTNAPIGSIDVYYALGLSVLGFGQLAAGGWPGARDVERRIRAFVLGGPADRHQAGAV